MTAPPPPELTGTEQDLLAGGSGEGVALAMRLVVGAARAAGARRLRPIESAHVDGCLHHGRAGLDFVERLVGLGGRVAVRTTLNTGSLDLRSPGLVRLATAEADEARRVMDGYVALGCEPTWTCAPYQEVHRPRPGADVAWGESNAVAFVNSVLGARSNRCGDFFDIAAAMAARVPDTGLHQDEARRATVTLDCSGVSRKLLAHDAGWSALGIVLGEIAGNRVAWLDGLDDVLAGKACAEDRLKALGAAAASSGGVALFHVAGVTPEAAAGAVTRPTHLTRADEHHVVTADLRAARDRLSLPSGARIDAVSLGTPHLSLAELEELSSTLAPAGSRHPDVQVYASTGRAVLDLADHVDLVRPLTDFGVRLVTDTCTYVTPVLGPATRSVMTNSGKWAWYAAGNLGVQTVLGTLTECAASAVAGKVVRDEQLWSD